ncbi:hypothetical protein ABZ439_37625 [Streptomyces sp. NPDC005840]|uniref:hypothetical protein n=1 Tax=Streptomyces sp. NPDC005840 TaxID=3157072 RepID=UPI00341096EA
MQDASAGRARSIAPNCSFNRPRVIGTAGARVRPRPGTAGAPGSVLGHGARLNAVVRPSARCLELRVRIE